MNELNPPKGLGFIVRTAGLDRDQARAAARPRLPAPALEGRRPADQAGQGPGADLPGNGHDHADHPRHLHHRHRHDLGRRAGGLRARPGVPRRSSCRSSPDRIKLYDEQASRCSTSTASRTRSPRSSGGTCRCRDGGSIVIDQTEALVAIDVNSGNFRAENNAEETAYQMNLQAAKEIARQLRLRDLGGVIVNDFIDMRDERHRRGVEQALRDAIKRDRARTKILRMIAVRHHRDDPPADPAEPEAVGLRGLPALPRRGRRQDGREHVHRRHAAPGPGLPPRRHPPGQRRRLPAPSPPT